jgi:phage terminase large subunit-like protein
MQTGIGANLERSTVPAVDNRRRLAHNLIRSMWHSHQLPLDFPIDWTARNDGCGLATIVLVQPRTISQPKITVSYNSTNTVVQWYFKA